MVFFFSVKRIIRTINPLISAVMNQTQAIKVIVEKSYHILSEKERERGKKCCISENKFYNAKNNIPARGF